MDTQERLPTSPSRDQKLRTIVKRLNIPVTKEEVRKYRRRESSKKWKESIGKEAYQAYRHAYYLKGKAEKSGNTTAGR